MKTVYFYSRKFLLP